MRNSSSAPGRVGVLLGVWTRTMRNPWPQMTLRYGTILGWASIFVNGTRFSPGCPQHSAAVTDGMGVIDRIAGVQTGYQRGMADVPVSPVIIESAEEITKDN